MLPCINFRLLSLTKLDVECCAKFFTQHGPDIRNLIIVDPPLEESHSQSYLRSMARMNLRKIQVILRLTPDLKTLNLRLWNCPRHLNSSSEMDINDQIPFNFPTLQILTIFMQWTNLFTWDILNRVVEVSPNLRVLIVPHWAELEAEGQVMDAVRETISKLQLRGALFNCYRWWGIPIYRVVADTHQKLKSLGLSLESGVNQTWEVVEAQEELLQSQADHLEDLFLSNGSYEPDDNNENALKLRLPVMKKLTSAELCFYHMFPGLDSTKVPFNLDPITPDQVPSLRKLHLYTPYLGLGVIADSPFRTLTQLILQDQEHDYYPGALAQVASRFPNLKKLHNLCILNLSLSDVTLMASSWPDMEDLFLTLKSDRPQTDFNLVLSGVLGKDVPFLCRFTSKSISLFDPSSHVHQKGYLPNRNFKFLELKKCVLNFVAAETESDNWWKEWMESDNKFHVDETSVYLTFLHLPSQLELHLTGDFTVNPPSVCSQTCCQCKAIIELLILVLDAGRSACSAPRSFPGAGLSNGKVGPAPGPMASLFCIDAA